LEFKVTIVTAVTAYPLCDLAALTVLVLALAADVGVNEGEELTSIGLI
jgi:hypothetical protein